MGTLKRNAGGGTRVVLSRFFLGLLHDMKTDTTIGQIMINFALEIDKRLIQLLPQLQF